MAIDSLKLPRLTHGWDKQPQLLERYWDIQATKLEGVLNQILTIPLIIDALADLDAAVAAAETAADNANNAASSITSEQSLVTSFPTNFVGALISSDNLGNVTIANHQRQYGDMTLNPTVAVSGAVLATGLSPGNVVRVYYNDPTRAGGSVTYLYTVDPADPPVQGGIIHSVGAVTIPAGGPVDGGPVRPPGFVSEF